MSHPPPGAHAPQDPSPPASPPASLPPHRPFARRAPPALVVRATSSPRDLHALNRLRFKVHRHEPRVATDLLDEHQGTLSDVHERRAWHLVAERRGHLVGAVQLMLGATAPFPPDLAVVLDLAPLTEALGRASVAVLRGLVLPASEGAEVVSALWAGAQEVAARSGARIVLAVAREVDREALERVGFLRLRALPRGGVALGRLITEHPHHLDHAELETLRGALSDHGGLAPLLERLPAPRVPTGQADAGVADLVARALGGLSSRQVARLMHDAVTLDLVQGAPVLREHAVGRTVYVVVSGEVGVAREGRRLATLGPGELVGEMNLVLGDRRTADVVVTSPTARLVALSSTVWEQVRQQQPSLALRVLEQITRVVGRRLRATAA